jgi:CheY-like chemotaxis protein
MEQQPVRGKRILVVDDDAGTRESVRLLLNIDRHTVFEASDGTEALQAVAEQNLDLVILDYFMPGMPGNELALMIKESAPGLPILMISAYLEKLGEKDKPVDIVLAKPFGLDELRQAVAQLLSS